MTPTIGRIVHFLTMRSALMPTVSGSDDLLELPAIIIAVRQRPVTVSQLETVVDLTVFADPTAIVRRDVPQDETKRAGSWHWPEREDPPAAATTKPTTRHTKKAKR